MNTNCFILLALTFFFGCKENRPIAKKPTSFPNTGTGKNVSDNIFSYETDTSLINNKRFVLSVYKNDAREYFKVEKESNNKFNTILVDSDYTTNNSNLFFKDENKDGYLDIVWSKKWQDHCYLFNPKKDNFYEVGEFHDIDTLRVNGKQVFFNNSFPLFYLRNSEKEFDWMVELHSELFIIDGNYRKISFATLDNFASLGNYNLDKCSSLKSVVVNCYIPPYWGKYGKFSIWNSGPSVDSLFMKSINSIVALLQIIGLTIIRS